MASRIHSHSRSNASKSDKGQVSLGKLSFRQRLESYYSVVQPDLLSCTIEWGKRFDQIWDKFGGTIEGEQLLATKLMKKYGKTAIPFQTVASTTTSSSTSAASRQKTFIPNVTQHRNEWYELNEKEFNSGCLDFLSDRFDPVAALRHNATEVETLNPFLCSVPIFDRVDQFRSHLPVCDPLHQSPSNSKNAMPSKLSRTESSEPNNSQTSASSKTHNAGLRHVPLCFVDTVKWHETGPYSILYDALINQQRIRVLVRYVNSIRGTLTGYVTAFDQHMNLLLRDVDEQYSPRRTTNEDHYHESQHLEIDSLSNGQAEVQRRISCMSQARNGGSGSPSSQQQNTQNSKATWTLRQRHMSQIMVRGDVIVLIYKASEERSAWTGTATAASSKVRPHSKQPTIDGRIGTPGSFVIPDKQRYARKYDGDRTHRNQTTNRHGKSDYHSHF